MQYEELLAKFDKEKKGGLYWRDMLRMIFHNYDVRKTPSFAWVAC